MNDNWIPIETLKDSKVGEMINVDTRDFHCITFLPEEGKAPSVKAPEYMTFEEIIERLKSWKLESGGEKEWRYISDTHHKSMGWFKYIHIWKTDKGYLWCCRENWYRSGESLQRTVKLKDEYC